MPTVAIPGPQPAVEIQALHLTDPVIACAVHAIQMAAYAQEAALLGVSRFPPLEQTLQDLQQSPARFLGAWIAGALIGALGVERTPDTPGVLIASLVVSPEWQRQGVGQTLLGSSQRTEFKAR